MTEGFGGLEGLGGLGGGGGGLDMGALLQQAQQMQQQLMNAQAELAATEITGTSGGVTVTVSGTGELVAVAFTPGGFDANDAESLDDLGDLVVAAYRDAKSKSDALAADKLGPLGSALGGLGGV